MSDHIEPAEHPSPFAKIDAVINGLVDKESFVLFPVHPTVLDYLQQASVIALAQIKWDPSTPVLYVAVGPKTTVEGEDTPKEPEDLGFKYVASVEPATETFPENAFLLCLTGPVSLVERLAVAVHAAYNAPAA